MQYHKEIRADEPPIDFLIGLTLMNAMPHFVLGVWKGRMLSAFGFGNASFRGFARVVPGPVSA
jgi:hypothetical protein